MTKTNRKPRIAEYEGVNLLCIGDTHEYTLAGNPWRNRTTIVQNDLKTMFGRQFIDAFIQVGDHTSTAATSEFTNYKAWRDNIKAAFPGIPWGEVPGNHDLIGNNSSGTPDLVTPAQWAAIMGYQNKDNVIDIKGRVRVLLVSPAADATVGKASVRRLTIDPATVAWIDARCDEVPDMKVVIVFHAPLPNTVGPLDGSAFSSYDERWHAHWDTGYALSDMISRHSNIVAWVAGHTHSRPTEVDIVKKMTYGSVSIASVVTSSPAFHNPDTGIYGPIVTALVTILPDRVEVRYRDHGSRQWRNPVHSVLL